MNKVERIASVEGPTRRVARKADSESAGVLAAQRKVYREAAGSVDRTGSEVKISGPLEQQREALSALLGETGFVNVVGQWRENFRTYLSRESFGMEAIDLSPAQAIEAAAQAAARISASPVQAESAQSQVQPQAAVKLLTSDRVTPPGAPGQ